MKNFTQKHEVDFAKQKVRPEVEEEVAILSELYKLLKNAKIKKVVDEMIMIYLDNLRTTKPKGGKKGGGKNRNTTKPPKLPGLAPVLKKDPRDLLGEVFVLISIILFFGKKLIEAGIVKKLMPAKIDDLLGEPDNLGCIYERQMKRMPDPSYSQIRQVPFLKTLIKTRFSKEREGVHRNAVGKPFRSAKAGD